MNLAPDDECCYVLLFFVLFFVIFRLIEEDMPAMEIARHNVIASQIKRLDILLKDHLSILRQNDHGDHKESKLFKLPDAKMFLPKFLEVDDKEKVSVFVKVNFLKIGTIDTTHDRYSAEVLVHLRWREPLLDSAPARLRQEDLTEFWNPKAMISNGIGELHYTTKNFINVDQRGLAWIHETRKTNAAHFFEFMELHEFPFDTQDLTITVTSERLAEELEFMPDDRSSVNAEAFSAAQEWQIHDSVKVWTKFNTKVVHKKKLIYPCLCVATKAARRPQFFIYNVIIIMFAICSLSFATFTVELEMPEARLPLTFLLVLTTVTFKLVVNKSLPKISYLTYLDKYVLGSMVILCGICIWQSISGSIVNYLTQTKVVIANSTYNGVGWCPPVAKQKSTYLSQTIDNVVMSCLGFIYLSFQIGFFIVIRVQKKKQRLETSSKQPWYSQKTNEYKKITRIEPAHE